MALTCFLRAGSHHSPDFPKVNAEIVMDQDVAHFDDLGPGYVLVGFPKGRGELAGCFADDLDVMDHPGMDEFVCFKCPTAPLHIPFNPLNGINNILQAPRSSLIG